MSKMTKEVQEQRSTAKLKRVTNFMGGNSYELNPLDTLKMVTASSIFGEPQYYRSGAFAEAGVLADGCYSVDRLVKAYSAIGVEFEGMKTSDMMEKVIDEALTYDFYATLQWAAELRRDYYMRLNPQVIMVRAAQHKSREAFTEKYPNEFARIQALVMQRGDEPASQLTYYLFKNKKKNGLPAILKRSWARRIERMPRWEMHKYQNKGLGLIDVVRISHAGNNSLIKELLMDGGIKMQDTSDTTWEDLRSNGKSWKEILRTIKIGHMALLRNIRGIFEEVNDLEFCKTVMEQLKGGVLDGKQFPFRYLSAMKAVEESAKINHKSVILDALETCMDVSLANMPKLKGKTMCLSDNSGSAWGALNSEYGSTKVADIDNLSSVITAMNSDEGYVGKFGDKLKVIPVVKRNGVLTQAQAISKGNYSDVGGSTENGIWIFFDNAIKKKEHWDNIFVYSDMQAGHGGLYGINAYEYAEFAAPGGHYIDVMKMIDKYRREVNPKVNIFTVQTAGYTNAVVPEYFYRGNVLYGWTGKELTFADAMIKFWDAKEAQKTRQ